MLRKFLLYSNKFIVFLSNPVVRNKFKDEWYDVVQHFLDYNYTAQSDKLHEVSKTVREFYKIENEPNKISHYVKVSIFHKYICE